MPRILDGLRAFQLKAFPRHRALFERLAHNQDPSALFITCSDSRVVPDLILQAEPGGLFHGHTNCGAMKANFHPEEVAARPSGAEWVRQAELARQAVERLYPGIDEQERREHAVQQNVILQVMNLVTRAFILSRVEAGALELHGWAYGILTRAVRGLDAGGENFPEVRPGLAGSLDELRMLRELEQEEDFWERLQQLILSKQRHRAQSVDLGIQSRQTAQRTLMVEPRCGFRQ